MTLICTVISSVGIVQLSDSNISSGNSLAGHGKKVFDLGFSDGALALAGAYSVGRQRMDQWMDDCIREYREAAEPTLAGFGEHLRERLRTEMSREESSAGSIVHLAGYTSDEHGVHPEMIFIRNIEGINDQTGDYLNPTSDFQLSEDFWHRDYLTQATKKSLVSGGYQMYFNGFSHGRIAFAGVGQRLREFYSMVWSEPDWQFHPPQSVEELARFVELEVRAVAVLFASSGYPPVIGGEIQTCAVPAPPNARLGDNF